MSKPYEKIYKKIQSRLSIIEKEKNVKILYAVESGSRAWGFESTDSDYDVRFIYKHDINWYLSIIPKRDVIEYDIVDEFDFSGWDLRKSLFLLNKSNPVLFEWLNSPIIYKKDKYFYSKILELSKSYFYSISSIFHYLHMAKGNYKTYLKTNKVKIKKYFYVLRPILACMWIEKFNETPPMEFERLLSLLDKNTIIFKKIKNLLEEKRNGIELGIKTRINEINVFIEDKIEYYEKFVLTLDKTKKPDMEMLNKFFIEIL